VAPADSASSGGSNGGSNGGARRLADLPDDELSHLLADVAAHLEPPAHAQRDLAAAVRMRIESEPPPPHNVSSRWSLTWSRVAVAGVAIVVTATAVLTFSPASREAIADWLGIRGVDIERRVTPPSNLGTNLKLGLRTSLADARRQIAFEVLLPPRREFGPPDEVYVGTTPSGGSISLVYRSGPDLPPAAPTNVGLLLTEFRAQIDEGFINKIVVNGGQLDEVSINGEPGYWFAGEPHAVGFADDRGREFGDSSRLAGNTLIWERGPLTLRLESALSKAEAVRIARALAR
jgi:hypothetical protein